MKRLILFLPIMLLCSCAVGTVKPHLGEPAFQAANQPTRTLSILVATDDSFSREAIQNIISRTSQSLSEQTGIALKVTSWQPIAWKTSRDRVKMLNQLIAKVWGKPYDLAVGFYDPNFGETILDNLLQTVMVPTWEGVIDDTYRRYIVVKTGNYKVLEHEICHAFILEHAHSDVGLMTGLRLKLLPFTPVLDTQYLGPEDRELVLKHKWRQFGDRQVVVGEPEDRITWRPPVKTKSAKLPHEDSAS